MNNIYIPYYGKENCELWPAGIETNNWKPVANSKKTFDILIYYKIHWDKERLDAELRFPIIEYLNKNNITYNQIIYGKYKPKHYKELLSQCHAMVFLSEHESQGFASCEAMSMNIPLFAWDQGFWLDPNRFNWTNIDTPATSVPFFDQTCGEKFKNYAEFEFLFENFWNKVQNGFFTPRQYIIENISLKKQYIIDELIQILKECSFDCVLNAPDIKGSYNCFSFGKDASGISYYPNISKDIIESHVVQNKKKVERTLTKGIYYEGTIYLYDVKKKIFYIYNDKKKTSVNIEIKKAKSIYIDKKSNEIFDTKSVNAGNPVKLGFISSNSKFSKKMT